MSNAIQIALKLTQNIVTDESNQDERLQRLVRFIGWQLWKRTVSQPLKIKLFVTTQPARFFSSRHALGYQMLWSLP